MMLINKKSAVLVWGRALAQQSSALPLTLCITLDDLFPLPWASGPLCEKCERCTKCLKPVMTLEEPIDLLIKESFDDK